LLHVKHWFDDETTERLGKNKHGSGEMKLEVRFKVLNP
jgi:hypothetical protein